MSKPDGKFISLPGLDSIKKKKQRERVQLLLDEAHALNDEYRRDWYVDSNGNAVGVKAKRMEEIKEELMVTQAELELPGFRNGPLTFAATWTEGRKQLNKDLLIENGVTVEQVQASYRQGEGYWKKELRKLNLQSRE